MFEIQKNKIIFTLSILALTLSACGTPSQTQTNISTAVAQTVQAQNSLTKVANIPIATSAPSLESTATADLAATNTTAPVVGAPGCTTSARLAGENPPDGTLLKPGETFLKTWSLQNTGTCTWDTTYKLVYRSGELLGGLVSYPLPEVVAPGDTKDISIYLKAPDNEGQVTGYWAIQTPWNTFFGVGATSDPFYVQVAVSAAKKPKYEVTSVTYKLIRDPDQGCPTNVKYNIYATITTNGPFELAYYWDQSDGNHSGVQNMTFTSASSQTIKRTWMVGKGDSPNPRWMQILIVAPVPKEFDRFVFKNNCP